MRSFPSGKELGRPGLLRSASRVRGTRLRVDALLRRLEDGQIVYVLSRLEKN
jgi:hypothetical protein